MKLIQIHNNMYNANKLIGIKLIDRVHETDEAFYTIMFSFDNAYVNNLYDTMNAYESVSITKRAEDGIITNEQLSQVALTAMKLISEALATSDRGIVVVSQLIDTAKKEVITIKKQEDTNQTKSIFM